MKPSPIILTIPTPCHEDWDKMTPTDKGHFCVSCQKQVIDFTTWNDRALHEFFSKQQAGVCGRFRSIQLNRQIAIPYQPHSRLYRLAIAAGLTLLFTQPVVAQTRKPTPIHYNYVQAQRDAERLISGLVEDNYGNALKDITVTLMVDERIMTTQTDSNGGYSFRGFSTGMCTIIINDKRYTKTTIQGGMNNSGMDIVFVDITLSPRTKNSKPVVERYEFLWDRARYIVPPYDGPMFTGFVDPHVIRQPAFDTLPVKGIPPAKKP